MFQSEPPSSSLRPRCSLQRSCSGRGRMERRTAAAAQGTVPVTENRGSACFRTAGAGREQRRPVDTPRRAQPRLPEKLQQPPPRQVSCSFRSFLSNTFAPPPPSSAPFFESPPRSASRRSRHRHRSPAGAGGCRAPRSPQGNFWTRCWCPSDHAEERIPGEAGASNQATATGGGAGQGRGDSEEAGPPGKPRRWTQQRARGGALGGAGRAAGGRSLRGDAAYSNWRGRTWGATVPAWESE